MVVMLVISTTHPVQAQKCYIPRPMTAAQKATVRGVWKGSYVLDGKQHAVALHLYTAHDSLCRVDGPPIEGRETGEQIRFCEGGEFHIRKHVGDLSYEFQGTPGEGKLEGLLTIRQDDQKVKNGRVVLRRE